MILMASWEWSNLSEKEFLSIELPANIIIRNWKWKATFQNYIDSLEKRVFWWPNADPDALRQFAEELRDRKPVIRVIDDRHVVVTYKGQSHTVIVPVPMQIKGPAMEAGGFPYGETSSRG
jgi:hypothetical protein